uniref:Serine protease n=1 Tax=uncultured organism TaxID=155900 RepID=D7GN91_9ZZZZ|nr:serine protease [uncultured organism]
MRKTLALLLAVAFLYLVPSGHPSIKSQVLVAASKFFTVANPIPNSYIVVLATTDLSPIGGPTPTPKATTPTSAQASIASASSADSNSMFVVATAIPADPQVVATATYLTSTYGGSFSLTWGVALKGFRLHATEAEAIAMSADSQVAFIVEDGAIAVGTPDAEPIQMTIDPAAFQNPQPHASWGLDRINQRSLPLDKSYAYHNDGQGVNAYVIDTGILTTHWEFQGRASAIYDFDPEGIGVDCNGHGTHVAGIIGGQTFGVAKQVHLLGVRVLNCQGTGTWSDVIDGVNFVTCHKGRPAQQGIPALANMSLAGGENRAVLAAVRNSIRAGVTYVVAAGNGNSDAGDYSPAGLAEAITVGTTDQSDARAEFSNYGSTLDLFAPGVSITSAWIGNDLMIATATGTSMAAPHVAGVVALYLQSHRSASPATVRSALVGTATVGVVRDPGQESPNRLLFTDY